MSWRPLGNTRLTLTKQYPLDGGNRISMRLDAEEAAGGIINTGFWGISVEAGQRYELSLYLRKADESSVSDPLHPSYPAILSNGASANAPCSNGAVFPCNIHRGTQKSPTSVRVLDCAHRLKATLHCGYNRADLACKSC